MIHGMIRPSAVILETQNDSPIKENTVAFLTLESLQELEGECERRVDPECDDERSVFCEQCQMWVNGHTQWLDHRIGKKHKKHCKRFGVGVPVKKWVPVKKEIEGWLDQMD